LYEFDQREDALVTRWTLATAAIWRPGWCIPSMKGWRANALRNRSRAFAAFCRKRRSRVLSPALISFRWHGLEFAQARMAHDPRNFQEQVPRKSLRRGPEERVLNSENETPVCRSGATGRGRPPQGRSQEPRIVAHASRALAGIAGRRQTSRRSTGRLRSDFVYAQVPAFAAADRAMIDILAQTREARLAVIELKADEDIHLPLQGVDYWSRVAWHQSRGEFAQFGYFPAARSRRRSRC
jgi:hypothetical protein